MNKKTYILTVKKNQIQKDLFMYNLKYNYGIISTNELMFNCGKEIEIKEIKSNFYQL